MAPMILVVDIGMLHMIPEQKTKKPRKITKQVGGMVCVTNGKRPKKCGVRQKHKKSKHSMLLMFISISKNNQKQISVRKV
jgi:hypothetical protein